MKLYVPNPQVWVDYFNDTSKGSSSQLGGGRKPYIITLKPGKKTDEKPIAIKAVLPTEQTVAQAKSELVRSDIKPREVEKAFQKSTQRRGENRKRKTRTPSSTGTKRQRGASKSRRIAKSSSKGQSDIFMIE